jgi:ABC-type phosphate transport system permease subunit
MGMNTSPTPVRRAPDQYDGVRGPMLIVYAAMSGLGVLYKLTGSLAVTAIAAVLAGVLGVAHARRVYYYRVRHWE